MGQGLFGAYWEMLCLAAAQRVQHALAREIDGHNDKEA